MPAFGDVTVTDDRGTTYALKVRGTGGHSGQPDEEPEPVRVIFRLEPAPAREAAWIELRAHDGPTTRLVTSPRAAVHVSDVTPVSAAEKDLEDLARLCASLTGERPVDDLPPAWSGMLSAANRSDGPACHLDIAAALPPIHAVVVQVDSLVSRPGGWKLYLRARPGWFIYSEDRMLKWDSASVHAEDDLGGGYISSFGGSTGHPGHEELALDFLPPLDPRARRLTLTFRAAGEQVAVAFDLPPNGQA